MEQKGTLLGIKHNEDGTMDFVVNGEDGNTYTAKGCRLSMDQPDANGEVYEDRVLCEAFEKAVVKDARLDGNFIKAKLEEDRQLREIRKQLFDSL